MMRTLYLFIAFFLSSLFCEAQNFFLIAGTYTDTGSKGIYVYNFNAQTAEVTLVSTTDSVVNPSFLILSNNKKFIYAVNETNGANPGKVSSFSFNEATGALKLLNTVPSGGDDPCYLSISNNSKWLAVANYTSGSLSAFPLNTNGSIRPYAQLFQDKGRSINKERQEKAHVHEAVFSPDNKYLFTPDLGMDKIMTYSFHPSSKQPLQPAATPFIKLAQGSGPRHIIFSSNKRFAYVISELSGTVTAYNYANGKLKKIQTSITHPSDYKGTIGSAEIMTSPDGKFLYASNRGDENTITIFSINAITGKLGLKGYQPVMGLGPRDFIIDPTGKYLLAANQSSDNIVIFKRNKISGLLAVTGQQIKIKKPVCLQMTKRNSE